MSESQPRQHEYYVFLSSSHNAIICSEDLSVFVAGARRLSHFFASINQDEAVLVLLIFATSKAGAKAALGTVRKYFEASDSRAYSFSAHVAIVEAVSDRCAISHLCLSDDDGNRAESDASSLPKDGR